MKLAKHIKIRILSTKVAMLCACITPDCRRLSTLVLGQERIHTHVGSARRALTLTPLPPLTPRTVPGWEQICRGQERPNAYIILNRTVHFKPLPSPLRTAIQRCPRAAKYHASTPAQCPGQRLRPPRKSFFNTCIRLCDVRNQFYEIRVSLKSGT